jgi:hypothetical protein
LAVPAFELRFDWMLRQGVIKVVAINFDILELDPRRTLDRNATDLDHRLLILRDSDSRLDQIEQQAPKSNGGRANASDLIRIHSCAPMGYLTAQIVELVHFVFGYSKFTPKEARDRLPNPPSRTRRKRFKSNPVEEELFERVWRREAVNKPSDGKLDLGIDGRAKPSDVVSSELSKSELRHEQPEAGRRTWPPTHSRAITATVTLSYHARP